MRFRLNHPLASKKHHFDSWMTLCEYTMEVALAEAKLRLADQLDCLMSEIADEMINTAVEIEF